MLRVLGALRELSASESAEMVVISCHECHEDAVPQGMDDTTATYLELTHGPGYVDQFQGELVWRIKVQGRRGGA